jgi:hypothetical protein
MSPEANPPSQSLRDRLEAEYIRREAELVALMAGVDTALTFAQLVQWALVRGSQDGSEAEHGLLPSLIEFAAFQLYPRFGQGGSQDSQKIEKVMDALKELNQRRTMRLMRLGEPQTSPFSDAARHAQSHHEHVRGSAYPPQTRRKIEGLLNPFADELAVATGIKPVRLLALLDVFEPVVNEQVNACKDRFLAVERRLKQVGRKRADGSYVPRADADAFWTAAREFEAVLMDGPWSVLVTFAQVQARVPDFSEAEWDAVERLCGMSMEARRVMTEPVEVKARPLFFFSERRFTLLDISSVYDAVFTAFDNVARGSVEIRDRYGHHVADWMEREVVSYLLRLFPSAHVYRTLDYPDPDNPTATAELDLLVSWGPFLILIEVKGKQFRVESQRGDESRLRSDLRSNIAEAFWQARRVIRYLGSVPTARLVERGSNRVVEVTWARVKRCFPLVITLEHFGGLATQLATLGDGRWFQAGTYPWAVSLADFDLITQFAGSPDVLLHYVQRRIQLQESGKEIHGDELDVFGLYLDSRLHPSNYWERETDGRPFTHIALTGGSARFDEWMKAEHDLESPRPEIKLALPPRFSAIVRTLRQSDDHDGRWIAVTVLDLSPAATEQLERDIGRILTVATPVGKIPRTTFLDGDLVVVAMANRGLPLAAFRELLLDRTVREKYRAHAGRAVGLGFDARLGMEGFVGAVWLESPWVRDEAAELVLANSVTRVMPAPGKKKPARNDPCPCGSGQKFKKCCLDRIEFVE